jgi:DNA polymerase III delta subunit
MLILLFGPDSFRREEKKREIIREFKAKHSLGQIININIEEDDAPERLKEFLRTRSLFDPAALFVFENAYEFGKKQINEFIEPHLGTNSFVFLISEEGKPPKQFSGLLKEGEGSGNKKGKHVFIQEFEALSGAAWQKFINDRARENGISLSKPALNFLAENYEKDTWGLVTEIEKVSNLNKKVIDVSDIEGADAPGAPDFFGMIGALKSSSIGERMAMLERLFALGEPAAKIFFIMAYQGANPLRFAKYDFAIKSGKFDYEEALVDAFL